MKVRGIIAVAVAVALSGCASTKRTTSLQVASPASGQPLSAVRYRVTKAGIAVRPQGGEADRYLHFLDAEAVARDITQAGITLFPTVFSEDVSAIPLTYTATVDRDDGYLMAVGIMLSTACIAGTILPCPFVFEYRVSSRLESGPASPPLTGRGDFWFKESTWCTLFSPLGILPFPGKSDGPRSSSADPTEDPGRAVTRRWALELFAADIARRVHEADPSRAANAPAAGPR